MTATTSLAFDAVQLQVVVARHRAVALRLARPAEQMVWAAVELQGVVQVGRLPRFTEEAIARSVERATRRISAPPTDGRGGRQL